MASIFTHAIAAAALGNTFQIKEKPLKVLSLAALCSIVPDADVVTFAFGIQYEDFLGHRGFFHSLVFALFFGILITRFFFSDTPLLSKKGIVLSLLFFLSTASHGLLDALTNGGLGVAFFSPFENSRYFFPYRPIQVSPIGLDSFFSKWGMRVLKSEFIWVVFPCLALNFIIFLVKQGIKKIRSSEE
jgi:inner membrane protein